MNEFTVKKLAEVAALCELSTVVRARAGRGFREAAPAAGDALEAMDNKDIAGFITEPVQQQAFSTKYAKTVEKLTAIMELYVGDDWDNPVEVLEWLSFYAGSASAHAVLAAAALSGLELSAEEATVTSLANAADRLLQVVKSELAAVGKERATP